MYDVEALRAELENAERLNELENRFREARAEFKKDKKDEDKKAAFKEAKSTFHNARRDWKLEEEAAGRRPIETTVVATNGTGAPAVAEVPADGEDEE